MTVCRLLGLFSLLGLLIAELVVVHDPADRRPGLGRHLHQVQPLIHGPPRASVELNTPSWVPSLSISRTSGYLIASLTRVLSSLRIGGLLPRRLDLSASLLKKLRKPDSPYQACRMFRLLVSPSLPTAVDRRSLARPLAKRQEPSADNRIVTDLQGP